MTDTTIASGVGEQTFRQGLPKRLLASGIHLGLSALIFLVALYLILVHWYPGFHFAVDGGWQGVRIMAAVDLVLGPMLTLIIFNPFKLRKQIVFDLACIGLIQLVALAWGFYAVNSQRPVSINFYKSKFYSMTAEPLKVEGYPLTLLGDLSERHPALIYVAPPMNPQEQARITMLEITSNIGAYEDPLRFKSFEPNWKIVRAEALNVQRLAEDPEFSRQLEQFLQSRGGMAGDYFYFPYVGRYHNCTVVFTAGGELLDTLHCVAFD